MAKVIDPVTLIPSKFALDVEIYNYNDKRLSKDGSGNLLRMFILENQSVAFQDISSGLYITKTDSSFEWEPVLNGPNHKQIFKLVESKNNGYAYGIQSLTGEYLGTDLVTFLKIAKWRWTRNIGDWESFRISVINK
jgi:hypothetical protein